MEETKVPDAQLPVAAARLNISCSLVKHFGVHGDIYIEIQQRRRKVVPMWFWERFEDQENPSHQLNQLLQALNPYFGKETPFFPTLSILALPQTRAPFGSRMWEFRFPPISQENEPTGPQEGGAEADMLPRRTGAAQRVLPLSPHLLCDLSGSVKYVGEAAGTGSDMCWPWEDGVVVTRGVCRSRGGFPAGVKISARELSARLVSSGSSSQCIDITL